MRTMDITPPKHGQSVELAEGLWWIRLKLDSVIDHVNVYLLDQGDTWVLIDTGSNTEACRDAFEKLLATPPFASKPVSKVIATHFHPDHIGLAGWFADRGAVLATSRLSWLYARMLQLDQQPAPRQEQITFAERAGLKGMFLEAFKRRGPSSYPRLVSPIPFRYQRLSEGEELSIGKRIWKVYLADGHAAGHLTLWSQDGIAITGDQILPSTVSHLMVSPSEPHEDLVSDWLASCRRFMSLAEDSTLGLPGHGLPFQGLPARCTQLIDNVEAALQRLLDRLQRPATAMDCLDAVYRRPLGIPEIDAFLPEVIGYLNHLAHRGLVSGELIRDGSVIWRITPLQDRSSLISPRPL